jgi:5-methylcytosine-specific restriction endonuclease McrA
LRHPEHKERHAFLSVIRRRKKPDVYKKHSDDWRRRNPERAKFGYLCYLARLRGAAGSHTLEEWLKIKTAVHGICPACNGFFGDKLTKDHIVPIFLGGTNYKENLQPLCKSCNSIKQIRSLNFKEGDKLLDYEKPVMRVKQFPVGELVR